MQHELLNNQNKPFLRWEFDKNNNWLYLNWIGFISTENLIKGADTILKEIEKDHFPYLLNDNRQLCGPWDSSNDYLQNHWIPRSKDAGLRYFAHVLAPNVAGALSAQDLHRHANCMFQMQLFGEIEKAKNWLKEMQEQDTKNNLQMTANGHNFRDFQ